jgi:hypothetical protein
MLERRNAGGDNVILSMSQLSAEWACPTQTIYKCIEDGMPYKKTSTEYEFNLQECEEWYRIGYFNSLSKTKQESVIRMCKIGR